ncbi:MAG: MFS transporter [Coriobacteriaceae bacterium]|nr:MFS transporter [Coriobacteriaceae bacterium]
MSEKAGKTGAAPKPATRVKLDYKHVALASLPFMGMISFWQVFDGIVPKMLTGTFGLDNMTTGAVMAIDNVFGLLLLPLFGILSDRCASRMGRRTPFILVGSVIATFAVPMIAAANGMESLPLLIAAILLTLFAICMYRTMTVAILCDITPRPLRTKADSIQKMVGYAGTGVMLVAIAVMVPEGDRPDYLPLFLLQAAFILVSALVYAWRVREPLLVEKMRRDSLAMGIEESQINVDDSPKAGGRAKITDRAVLFSVAMLLAATFFYYMSYNAMTTNISRYADMFYNMEGGSYAIINIVTILGALAGYVPIANISLKVGRKKVAVASALVMAAAPAVLWLVPGFSPVFYLVFLVLGVALGGVDMCVYTMLLEVVDANSVGRYSGYYYTVSMAAQVATPILSGMVMDAAPGMLFAYIALMGVLLLASIALARHGDTVLIDEVERREAEYAAQ